MNKKKPFSSILLQCYVLYILFFIRIIDTPENLDVCFISDLENDNAEKTHKSNNNNLLLTLKNVEHNRNK